MALYYATRNIKALGRPLSSLWKTKSFNYSSFNTDLQLKLKSDAQTIFGAALSAVSPQEMVKNNLLFHQNILSIKEREYTVDKNVSVVAFGKAVLGMAKAVDDILRDQIVRGVASIPVGLPDVIKVGIGCSHLQFFLLSLKINDVRLFCSPCTNLDTASMVPNVTA